MESIAVTLVAVPALVLAYTYVGYPLLLGVFALFRPRRPAAAHPQRWPSISITLPAYNEEQQIRGVIENLLRLDYPADRRQILVVSDASTDATDAIVTEYGDRGVELLRVSRRGGKTAAENAALPFLTGEIVVNTDASTRFDPAGLKRLIACFTDPSVGVASGRDVSVTASGVDANQGEAGYVGYEMWIRRLETRLSGIVGASGCYYAIRAELHRTLLPEAAVRDFAAPLIARERGYRSVSVDVAVCYVPRTHLLRYEYRRKVRTMSGGMDTLLHFRHLLHPVRYGAFGWMLASHKLCRWLAPVGLVPAMLGLSMLAYAVAGPALTAGALAGGVAVAGLLGWAVWAGAVAPRWLRLTAYSAAGNLAVLHAWSRVFRGKLAETWEPTPRDAVEVTSRGVAP